MPVFDTIDSALRGLAQLEHRLPRSSGAWDVPHVLHHVAQNVEYSMRGYPRLRPAWYRATLGPAAFALFSWRERMHHGLAAPVPGAPPIAQGMRLDIAIAHLAGALRAFEQYDGPLQPHFAFGALDKPAFTRAHLLHLNDHWSAFASD